MEKIMRHILYFTADWCNPCKKVKPIVEELNRDSSIKFQFIDVDQEIEMAKDMNVRSIPTFIVIDDGLEVKRATGAQTKEQLERLISDE
jgi:thioredoxin 1